MLVLSRKKNESIVINGNIQIVVVEIRGDKVRLGIEAPADVPVHRREVYEAIKRAGIACNAPYYQDAQGRVTKDLPKPEVPGVDCPRDAAE